MKLNRSIDQSNYSSGGNSMSELNPSRNAAVEPTRIVVPIAESDEVRRWYAVLKFCPSDSFDPVESPWNQSY